ncbi:NAD(P)-binding domain-containing protein [Marisediminicola sp. LYQ85]|uniref:NAD(P)-binding domain-containing protein n=1 Tax=Marisediminicola sp. LYQ85 TaxID=3391062 RepID=UPI00398302B8
MPFELPRREVVVIGAGQAGLAVTYFLQRLGLSPAHDMLTLDRGPGAGGAWQHRWSDLRIGTAHRINDLPGMSELGLSFETADRKAPAKTVVADYYARYEEHFGLQVHRPATVTSVVDERDDLVVAFTDDDGDHEVVADVVVNASGTWGSPFMPYYPGYSTFSGRHVHTADYRSAFDFAGQSVVVVGGGTSAVGFLLELERHASDLLWVSRRPVQFLAPGDDDLEGRLAAVRMQDEAAREGRPLPSIVSGTGIATTRRIAAGIDRGVLVAYPMFTRIEPEGVLLPDGTLHRADAIVWATGFRPEVRHLAPLGLREAAGGLRVRNGVSESDPRVFFAGYGPSASTIGANRAGRSVARHVVAALHRDGSRAE